MNLCVCVCVCVRMCVCVCKRERERERERVRTIQHDGGRSIRCLKLQVSFRKKATNHVLFGGK